MSSVAKDCLVLPQYDLPHGTFLLITPIVMSSYKGTIIQRKSTSLQSRAVLSKLCSKSYENSHPPSPCGGCFCLSINLGSPPLGLAVKSSGSDFLQALGSVLPLTFVHLPIVLSDPVLAYPAPGR